MCHRSIPGRFSASSSSFCCSFAKTSFGCHAFNHVFNKVGRVASQKVAIELLMSICAPVFNYGSEFCPISESQFSSLEFFARCGALEIADTLI